MKDNKYVILLLALLALYVVYEMSKPQEENWTPTYSFADKEPFGAFALYDLSKSLFNGEEIKSSFKTIYELYEEDKGEQNILIVADQVAFAEDETELILDFVENGGTVLIATQQMKGELADTFSLNMREQATFFSFNPKAISESLAGETVEEISFQNEFINYPFLGALSSFDQVSDDFEVLAKNSINRPVLLKYAHGEGQIYLSSMPLAFTNYFTLLPETTEYTEHMMALFPSDEPPLHIEYYQLGRLESSSPIRVLLADKNLRMAIYILMAVILVFIIFQAKRRQRIIPVLQGNPNLSLEFVRTLGSLYYRQLDHKNILKKRVLYWKEFVRTHYNLNTQVIDEAFVQELANKSGHTKESIEGLTKRIISVDQDNTPLREDLIKDIEDRLNQFYGIS